MTHNVGEHNGHRKRHHDFEHRSPEEIQRELDATRREMADTIHALERELSSGQLVRRAFDVMRAGPGRFSENLGQTVINNPVPVALIGIGLLWLSRADAEHRVEFRETGEGIKEKLSRTGERAREIKDRSQERVRRSYYTVQRTWNENPMLVGVCAMAAGALLAATIPKTERERELIGTKRDQLVEGAKRTARAAVEGARSGVEQSRSEVSPTDEPLTTDLYPEGRTIR